MKTQAVNLSKVATELSLELLPDSIFEIANLIGIAKAMQLVQAFGGTELRVPVGMENSMTEQALIHAVGDETAQLLMEVYGGDRLYIPRCEVALKDWRDNRLIGEIRHAVMNGMSQTRAIRQLAIQYELSERRIYELLKERLPQQQPRLF